MDLQTLITHERVTTKSADGSLINVTVTRPVQRGADTSAILLIPGTGSFDEDVYLGTSGSLDDLIFRDLALGLAARGHTVVRYAKRGVSCSPGKLRLFESVEAPEDVRTPDDPELCLDRDMLSRVTMQTLYEDVTAAYGIAATNSSCVVAMAHSEGFAHLALAIEAEHITPAGVVGIGALLESPQSVVEWQRADRVADSLTAMDTDRNGVTTNDEVETGYARNWTQNIGHISNFLSPTGSWTAEQIEAVRIAWRRIYESEREAALRQDPDSLMEMQGQPVSSYRWWQSWFNDSVPVAERFRSYVGPTTFFYGTLDSQTPPERQIVAHRRAGGGTKRRFVVFEDLGHTLGNHVFMGPVTPQARLEVLDEVDRISRQVCTSAGSSKK